MWIDGKPASDGEIHKLALESQAAAAKLKARTLTSDIFFVEANASFEAWTQPRRRGAPNPQEPVFLVFYVTLITKQ